MNYAGCLLPVLATNIHMSFTGYYSLRFISILFLNIHLCKAELGHSYSMLQYGRKLEKRMISSYINFSILDCVEDCLRTTRCRSINYCQGAHFCQTNFENRTTVPDLYTENSGWIYSDIENWDREITGACLQSDCAINEKCIPKPFNKFTCILSDCGVPNDEGYSMENVQENDAIGISRRIHVTCKAGYNKEGSGLHVCRSDGVWKTNLKCTNNLFSKTACEEEEMILDCAAGNISIVEAIYGRTQDNNVCHSTKIKSLECRSTKSEAIVKSVCDAKPNCRITVSNTALGGDPCPGTHKYLNVKFTCF